MAEAGKPKLFISYSRKDMDFAKKPYEALKDDCDVWWDQEEMEARGDTFLDSIQRAIVGADRLLLLGILYKPKTSTFLYLQF